MVALALLASALLTIPPAARPDDPLTDLGQTLVPELVELAEWCQSEKLLGTRLAVYEAVLAWSPDHGEARRVLGFKEDRAGGWTRSRPMRAKRDRRGLEAELAAHRGAVVDRALAWIDARWAAERAEAQPPSDETATAMRAVTPLWVRAAHLRLLGVAPDHGPLREALGQVRVQTAADGERGRWVRADAARALERLAAREAEVQRLRETSPKPARLKRESLEASMQSASVGWKSILRLPGALVAGTVNLGEAERIAVSANLTQAVASAALPSPPLDLVDPEWAKDETRDAPWRTQPWFLVVSGKRDREALLQSVGRHLEENEKELLRTVHTGFLHEENVVGVWAGNAEDRHEGAIRQKVGIYLRDTFGVKSRHGWIWEGVGLLLSGPIAGRKTLVYVRLQPDDRSRTGDSKPPTLDELTAHGVDWFAVARDRVRAWGNNDAVTRKLSLLLGKDVNSMDADDLVLAHALGAFLVDGHPDVAPRVLVRIGRGEPSSKVLEAELGERLPNLARGLAEWLEDIRPAPRATESGVLERGR